MAKSIKSVYFDSAVLLEAERQKLDIGGICNEALRLAVNKSVNQGTTEGALGNFLEHEAHKRSDLAIIKRLHSKQHPNFNQGLKIYAERYNLSISDAMKEVLV